MPSPNHAARWGPGAPLDVKARQKASTGVDGIDYRGEPLVYGVVDALARTSMIIPTA